jgi:hypothetical protein
MNRFEKLALAAAILVSLRYVRGPGDHTYEYYRAQIPEGMLQVGLAGWALSTFGPIAVALLFWRWAKWIHAPWLLHLSLLPCMLALTWIGHSLMLSVIDDSDFDATLGAPVIAGFLLSLIAIGGYFGGLVALMFSKSGDRANSS